MLRRPQVDWEKDREKKKDCVNMLLDLSNRSIRRCLIGLIRMFVNKCI
jgi:hypothetical protein